MSHGQKIFFVSDLHLGTPSVEKSKEREKLFLSWLQEIQPQTKELYIVGDLFDFWFEYKQVVPKGYVRVLAKLAEFVEQGASVYVFTGNHDMWMFDYLHQELGVQVLREPILKQIGSSHFMIGHGDGLGPGDYGYKFIKKIFANPVCQWLFGWIHPNIGVGMAQFWSRKSRASQGTKPDTYLGDDKEFLMQYCKKYIQQNPGIQYFVFGHRHLPLEKKISETATYYNLGDWIQYFSYGEFDINSDSFSLRYFRK